MLFLGLEYDVLVFLETKLNKKVVQGKERRKKIFFYHSSS